MKRTISLIFIIMLTITVFSQDKPFERKGGKGELGHNSANREMHHLRFAKHILSERCITEAKITPEQVQKLKKEFDLLDKQMSEIGKAIGEASKRQAEVAVKVLTTPGSDPQEMMVSTEEIGRMRTEQAKLSVKVLVVIRDTLLPEQCAKVVMLMKEERDKMRKRMEYMREKMQGRRAEGSGSGATGGVRSSKMREQ